MIKKIQRPQKCSCRSWSQRNFIYGSATLIGKAPTEYGCRNVSIYKGCPLTKKRRPAQLCCVSGEERSNVQPPHPTTIEDDIHSLLLHTKHSFLCREWNRRLIIIHKLYLFYRELRSGSRSRSALVLVAASGSVSRCRNCK